MDLIKPPNEYIVIHNDLSVNTISHSPHHKPETRDINVPTIVSEHDQPKVKTGYRSTLTTPDGKPLFNCLLQHNPQPVYSHELKQCQMTESQKKLAEEKRNWIINKRKDH